MERPRRLSGFRSGWIDRLAVFLATLLPKFLTGKIDNGSVDWNPTRPAGCLGSSVGRAVDS